MEAHIGLPASAIKTADLSEHTILAKRRKPTLKGRMRLSWSFLILPWRMFSTQVRLPHYKCRSFRGFLLRGILDFSTCFGRCRRWIAWQLETLNKMPGISLLLRHSPGRCRVIPAGRAFPLPVGKVGGPVYNDLVIM